MDDLFDRFALNLGDIDELDRDEVPDAPFLCLADHTSRDDGFDLFVLDLDRKVSLLGTLRNRRLMISAPQEDRSSTSPKPIHTLAVGKRPPLRPSCLVHY